MMIKPNQNLPFHPSLMGGILAPHKTPSSCFRTGARSGLAPEAWLGEQWMLLKQHLQGHAGMSRGWLYARWMRYSFLSLQCC